MSGVEAVAGLALAAVPLFVEAFDHSDSIIKGIKILGDRTFTKQLSTVQMKLGNQKSIFRVTSRRLLSIIEPSRTEINQLLRSAQSPNVRIEGSAISLETLDILDDLFVSCQSTLKHIQGKLKDITASLQTIKMSDIEARSVFAMNESSSIGSRLTLAWKNSSIEQKLQDLAQLNQDFAIMSKQTVKILKVVLSIDQGQSSETITSKTGTRASLDAYKHVKHASLGIYDMVSLMWHCGLHEKHLVHVCQPNPADYSSRSTSLSFNLVVSPVSNEVTNSTSITLEVQHHKCKMAEGPRDPGNVNEVGSSEDLVHPIISGLKRPVDELASSLEVGSMRFVPEERRSTRVKLSKRPKFVHFHPNLPLDELSLHAHKNSLQEDNNHKLGMLDLDLKLITDHCNHFGKSQSSCSVRQCLGYLESNCIHRFFVQPESQASTKVPQSLAQTIIGVAEDPLISTLPRKTTLYLGGSLASLVLQYHSTPWLPDRWGSNDVCFTGLNVLDSMDVWGTQSPYLSVSFSKNRGGKGKAKAVSCPEPMGYDSRDPLSSCFQERADASIRNEPLFSLGVVLLELGYSKPWRVLRENILDTLSPTQKSDYHVAEKLAWQLVRLMGPAYPRIIRQCIACDFGAGEHDLDNDELQLKFVHDVVDVLRGMELGIAKLGKMY